jgi:excisionase family DNA binding protein
MRLAVAMQTEEDKLLTVGEVAQRLRLSIPVVRSLVNAGRVPVIRLNQRVWRFHWPTVLHAISR